MDGFINDALTGYGERVKRLAILSPLFQLKQKRQDSEAPVDWFGLGLLTLLFFFENMLHRRNKNSANDLADFLCQVAHNTIPKTREDFFPLAETIIHTFRDPGGKKQEENFYNWESCSEESFRFSILKTAGYDKELNRQYYVLDDAGLELVFATKEYYSEFRISINQLLIRKQLEKGEFANALHEINEMRIAVEAIRENIRRLGQEVARNIISDETYQKYKRLVTDTHQRLEREDEEFRELYSFVNETKNRRSLDLQTEKDEQAYRQLVQIARELGEVHQLHQQLLYEAVKLKNKALESAKQALYSAGIQAFNFEQELISRITASPLPPVALAGLIRPFVRIHRELQWSPLVLFAPQRLQKPGQEWDLNYYPELDDNHSESNSIQQRTNFTSFMQYLLEAMGDRPQVELAALIEQLPEKLLLHRSFYDFLLLLHQRSPIFASKLSAPDEFASHLLDGALTLLKQDVLVITELPQVLQPTGRYRISNLLLERKDGGL